MKIKHNDVEYITVEANELSNDRYTITNKNNKFKGIMRIQRGKCQVIGSEHLDFAHCNVYGVDKTYFDEIEPDEQFIEWMFEHKRKLPIKAFDQICKRFELQSKLQLDLNELI